MATAQIGERITHNAPHWRTCDGQGLKQLAQAALVALEQHEAAINALNVFPVPDGDTGTNMVLTMRSAWAEVAGSPETHVGRMAQALAYGALMGARGNSGVILSQVWRGFAETVRDLEAFDAPALARGLRAGYETAYRSIAKPVEGTILTVAQAAAEAAGHAAQKANSLPEVMEHLVTRAREAVALTPELLAILREAGVVDAGGQGLYIVLESMLRTMRGEALTPSLPLPRLQVLRARLRCPVPDSWRSSGCGGDPRRDQRHGGVSPCRGGCTHCQGPRPCARSWHPLELRGEQGGVERCGRGEHAGAIPALYRQPGGRTGPAPRRSRT
ncbi:MAG: hypothetical protein C4309_02350 [Chloroflexota bacterium]